MDVRTAQPRSDLASTADPPAERVDLSIVVPLYDEAESLEPLHERIHDTFASTSVRIEMVFVDDGSRDESLERLRAIAAEDPRVRVVSLRRNYGKSAALAVGFQRARGRLVATCDADLQDDPSEIPGMMAMIDAGADLISGWKKQRRDPITKRWPSKLFNAVVRVTSGVRLHDMNCGLKVYRREVVESIPIYGELHRYLPVLAAWRGFDVREKVVRHEPRRHGVSKFGHARFVNGFLDLLSVKFLTSGQQSPLHLFGRIALFLFAVGFGVNLWMFGIWIQEGALRARPLLILGMVLVILSIQFISIGLLGEMLAYHNRRTDYGIKFDSDEGNRKQ